MVMGSSNTGLQEPLKRFWSVFLLLAVFLLAGCQSELYSNLEEREANEMISVLAAEGIEASRTGDTKLGFTVSVGRSDFSTAISKLSAKGLPRQNYGSLGNVFTSDKLVSTPFEERARFMHALNEELANSITRINGVVSARVHIMVPEASPFDKIKTPPRASVFIYHQKGMDLRSYVPTIKNLIVNSLDNMEYANVEVALFAEQTAGINRSVVSTAGAAFWNLLMIGILAAVVFLGFRFSGREKSAPKRPQIGKSREA